MCAFLEHWKRENYAGGLILEMNLASFVPTSRVTNGAVVNEYYQTAEEWLFSCGNILHDKICLGFTFFCCKKKKTDQHIETNRK